MCCPEASSASATSAISPVPTEPLCSHSLACSSLANLDPDPRHRQLPVSHLALPTLRSQHEHRAQPHRATTGLSMQTVRLLLIPTPSNGSRTCAGTSSHTCVLTAKLRPYHLFLPACSSRNHPFPQRSISHCTLSRPSFPDSSPAFTEAKSRPQLHSSAHHCQPSSF